MKRSDGHGRGRLFCWVFGALGLLFLPTLAVAKPGHLARWSLWKGEATFWVSGQYRPRLEFMQQRDFRDNPTAKDRLFISHRARLTVGAEAWKRLKVVLQVQDVRLWGSETDTLNDFSADGLDMHQAYAEVRVVDQLYFKLGRMELNYDNQRLIGAVGWLQQARSFDAAMMMYKHRSFQLHAWYAHLSEKGAPEDDSHLAMLWFRLHSLRFFQPSLMYIFDHNAAVNRLRHTFGTHTSGGYKGFGYTFEFYLQLGSQEVASVTQDLLAYMLAASAKYTIPVFTRPTFRVWAEFLSGDDNLTDSTIRVFDTLYATNHKFYGYVDTFLNIPAHTGGRGLMDFGLSFQLSPARGFSLQAAFHYFRLFTPTQNLRGETVQEVGPELDITAKYAFLKGHLVLAAGYGFLVPMAGLQALGKGDRPEHWFFVQTDAKF